MDCVSSNKGSYAWKSLFQAKYVLKKGLVWRVGNRQSINIRNDKWISKFSCSNIVSPISVLPSDAKVCDLIDAKSHSWKSELIHQEFLPHEASLIIGILLSCQAIPDTQVWLLMPQGSYSTRSAYKLLLDSSKRCLPRSSTPERCHFFWNGI